MARAAACRHYVTVVARKPAAHPPLWVTGVDYLAELRASLIATANV
jgi:hypothetical protein